MYSWNTLSTRRNGHVVREKKHFVRWNGKRDHSYFYRLLSGGGKKFSTQKLAVLSKECLICMLYHQEKPLTPSSQKSLQCRLLLYIYSLSSAPYPTCQVGELNMSILLHLAEIHWEKPERCAFLSWLLFYFLPVEPGDIVITGVNGLHVYKSLISQALHCAGRYCRVYT